MNPNLLPPKSNTAALDLSLTGTGFCCDGHTECWRSKLRGHERLQFILKKLSDAIDKHGVTIIYIEGFSFGSKGQSVVDLGGLGWLVRHYLWARGITYVNVPPGVLKKYCTGKGNANKNDMIAEAIRRFQFMGSDDNEADAWVLWHLAMEHQGKPIVKVPKDQALSATKVEVVKGKV